ncbi:MAG: hypothetical protein IKI11_02495 [Neisseriaceae bacterium]|nr:hypothetical protein [Neisseriaceae bacterium]MBR7001519.1 hypothetical protein [Neisseriaceae bacterium]
MCAFYFFRLPERLNAKQLKRLTAFVLPNGKTGLPRFFLRKNLAMTRVLFFRLPESV